MPETARFYDRETIAIVKLAFDEACAAPPRARHAKRARPRCGMYSRGRRRGRARSGEPVRPRTMTHFSRFQDRLSFLPASFRRHSLPRTADQIIFLPRIQ
jgi:hypothetical protein